MGTLENILFGSPIEGREEPDDSALDGLDATLRAVMDLLGAETRFSPMHAEASREWGLMLFKAGRRGYASAAAKRAALLLALWKEEAVREHFAAEEPVLVGDLHSRVLPLVMPRFVANMCQSPDALLATVCLMSQVWREVPFAAAHVEESVGGLGDRADGEGGGAPSRRVDGGEGCGTSGAAT